MAIHTSAIFYSRGINPKSYNAKNFAFVAQTNNTIISPMNKYMRGYNFYNRTVINTTASKLVWNN
jgi:hypothetical protein